MDGDVGEGLLGGGVAVERSALLTPFFTIREEHKAFVGGCVTTGIKSQLVSSSRGSWKKSVLVSNYEAGTRRIIPGAFFELGTAGPVCVTASGREPVKTHQFDPCLVVVHYDYVLTYEV